MENRNFVNMNVNPCKMCMPMGAALALKGIEKSIMFLHGSQGCSTYIRRHIATHFNEPVDIASSSLTEKGTVYGGEDNLKIGLKNTIKLYNPDIIGIATTCLAETIGEDVDRISREFSEESGSEVKLVPISTPGYGGSQYEGYYWTLRKILEHVCEESPGNGFVNIIIGSMTPADIRKLKDILDSFSLRYILFPDISETLDGPTVKEYQKIPDGGTGLEEIKKMSGSTATIEFGRLLDPAISPGKYLEDRYGVPLYSLPVPIGLENTNILIETLAILSKNEPVCRLNAAKGRMLDGMIDSHKYNAEGRAAIFGQPELVYSVSKLCLENGIIPAVIATGSSLNKFKGLINENIEKCSYESVVVDDTDFEKIGEMVKEHDVNILIGNSDGKFIKEKQGIPLVRIGFPIHDHIGAQRKVNIGYEGSLTFLDEITNTLLDIKHDNYREDLYKEYYNKV
ncbi:MAG: nitrogenase component 1 [Halanaerobiaceae bacterium]